MIHVAKQLKARSRIGRPSTPSSEIVDLLNRNGVPASQICAIKNVAEDPSIEIARRMIIVTAHPIIGSLKL